jgi:hypothetical protein
MSTPPPHQIRVPKPHTALSILTERPVQVFSAIAILAGIFLPVEGLGIPSCSFHTTTGLPCPGCGLTRSVTAIFHGEWALAWRYNPFGYGFAFAFVALAALGFVPRAVRERWREDPPVPDRIIGMAAGFFLAALIAFGGMRIYRLSAKGPGAEWWHPEPLPAAYLQALRKGS